MFNSELFGRKVIVEQAVILFSVGMSKRFLLPGLHQLKIKQVEGKIRKIEEGFDGGLYSLEEAKKRKIDYQDVIEKARQ